MNRTRSWLRLLDIAAVLVLLAITVLLLIPEPYKLVFGGTGRGGPHGRGLGIHFTVYIVQTWGLLWLMGRSRIRQVSALIVAHAFATETAQYFIPKRDCDPLDLVANVCGIAVALGAVLLWERHGERWGLREPSPLS